MTEYCLGIILSPEWEPILHSKQSGPVGSRGFNGFGGKIEDETPEYAMHRELLEEVGVERLPEDWVELATIGDGRQYKIHVFTTRLTRDEMSRVGTGSIRHTRQMSWPEFNHWMERGGIADNIEWLIPLARTILRKPSTNISVIK